VVGRVVGRRTGANGRCCDRARSLVAAIVLDFRRVARSLDIESALDGPIRGTPKTPGFPGRLGRLAVDPPPKVFFGDLVVERGGERSERLDLEQGGLTPIATPFPGVRDRGGTGGTRRASKGPRGHWRGRIKDELREGLQVAFRVR